MLINVTNFSMIMSVWGVLFLGLLGVFFYVQAVNLFPDLHFEQEEPVDGVVLPLTTASVAFSDFFVLLF